MARTYMKIIPHMALMPKTEFIKERLVENDEKELRKVKMIDKEKYPFSVEIDIYGKTKTSFMSGKEALGVLVESTEIHNTMKSIFELIWKKT